MTEHPDSSTLSFTLKPVPPFRLDCTVWSLRRRPGNAIDRWDGVAWRRVNDLARGICEVRVTQTGPLENPNLGVLASGRALTADAKSPIRNLLTRMLGLDRDLSGFYHLTRHNRTMASFAERFRGVRMPRFPTIFEALVNASACQQISLKAQALIELSSRVVKEDADLSGLEAMSNEEAVEKLLELRGVGRWTADYALLRGMGRFMIFPAGDVGARNKLQDVLHISKSLDDESVRRRLRRWDACAGLIDVQLLLSGLADEGLP